MTIGTPLTSVATKALLLGSGELGKEVALELQRYGVEVIACDKYANAPAMQVAHRLPIGAIRIFSQKSAISFLDKTILTTY